MTDTRSASPDWFLPGTEVEVRTRYLLSWTRGFEVVAVDDGHDVWLRRRSDGATLPMPIGVEQIRPLGDPAG
jgi:hypothetical protein